MERVVSVDYAMNTLHINILKCIIGHVARGCVKIQKESFLRVNYSYCWLLVESKFKYSILRDLFLILTHPLLISLSMSVIIITTLTTVIGKIMSYKINFANFRFIHGYTPPSIIIFSMYIDCMART